MRPEIFVKLGAAPERMEYPQGILKSERAPKLFCISKAKAFEWRGAIWAKVKNGVWTIATTQTLIRA